MDFCCFLIWAVFFHFIAFGLRPSGLGYDGFFFFFDLGLLLPFFFAFGLSPSCLGYDGFFLFFDLGLLFPFHCLWFKSVGFSLCWFFLFFY